MGILDKVLAGLSSVLLVLVLLFRGQRDNARHEVKDLEEELIDTSKTLEIERNIREAQSETLDEANEEAKRQKTLKESGARPEYFGDSRLHRDS